MYNQIKKFLSRIIPKDVLIKNEPTIRKVMYLFYKGSKHECNICEKKNRKFVLNQRGEKLCPNCGSMPRDRRLFMEFEKQKPNKESFRLLDFSPSRSLYRKFKSERKINYFPSDLSTNFIAEYQYDITKIPIEDNYFDFIICYHILEHVEKDADAMKELFRVVTENGQILVQTPFKEGNIYEDFSITSPEERLKHFGQDDHVRIYSVEGLKQRLTQVGFKVNTIQFEADEYLGLNKGEIILELTK